MRWNPTRERRQHDADMLAFDWSSLGQCVQEHTLEAVAIHLALMAALDQRKPAAGREASDRRSKR